MTGFAEIPVDVPLDHELPGGPNAPDPSAAPAEAAPDAPHPNMWTPEQEHQILNHLRETSDPAKFKAFVDQLGKENGVTIPMDGPGGVNDLFEWKRRGAITQRFAIPDFARGQVQPDQPPEGMQELPADAKVDYGTLSGLSPDEIKLKYERHPAAEMIRRGMETGLSPVGMTPLQQHGFTAGLDTEAKSLSGAVASFLTDPLEAIRTRGKSVSDAYGESRTEALARLDYLRMLHEQQYGKWAAPVEEISGALANPVGSSARTVKGLAMAGAAYGGISGFEDSNGDLGERLGSAATHAAIGAAAAPVIVAGIKAPKAVLNLLPGRRVASELTQAFDRQQVDPLAAYVGGTGSQMASGVAHMTLGGIPLSEAANKTIMQARAARDRIASVMGWVKDGMGAGRAAQRGSTKWMDTTEGKATSLYHAIPVPADKPSQLGNTVTTLRDLNAGLESNPELSALISDPRLKGFQAALEGTTDQVPPALSMRPASRSPAQSSAAASCHGRTCRRSGPMSARS
jgi:hypothetical protein